MSIQPAPDAGTAASDCVPVRTERQDRPAIATDPELARLRTLFDDAPSLVAVHEGPEHHFVYLNRLAERMAARPLLGRPLRAAMAELEGQGHFERFDEVFRTGKPSLAQELKVAFLRPEMNRVEDIYLNHGLQPWLDADGGIRGVISIALEVTELVRARNRLRESEQRYRALLERANDAIFVFAVEADGRPGPYLQVNEVACRRLGYSRDELLALTPEAIVDTGEIPYRDALDAAMLELRTNASVMVERIHVAKDGRRIPVEVSATLLDLDGTPAVVAIARDITERKRAAEAIRESEERLRFTLEAAKVGTWEWRMSAGKVRWSDNLEEIHGLPKGSFGGDFASFLADVHPDDRAKVMAAIEGAHEGDGFYQIEYRLPGRDGEELWVEGKGRTLCDESGRPVQMTGICTDITARKKAERTLEFLLRELQHRVKNTLAVVQSLATQSMRNSTSFEAFSDAFSGRLAALAEAHSLLAGTKWQGARIHDVIVAELSPWQAPDGDRLELRGPHVMLLPKAALTLGMVFHELATNALKYGALSTERGRIEIAWSIEDRTDGKHLRLIWTEIGGPRVQPPTRHGFGTQLIGRSVKYELSGEATLDFRIEGARCEITFPLDAPTSD